MEKMKAVFCTKYGPPEVLVQKKTEKPIPKDHEVLIKVKASTVSMADYRIRSFDVPKSVKLAVMFAMGFKGPRNPILGAEFSGIVITIGSKVSRFKPGDEVYCSSVDGFGAYAEFITVKEDIPLVCKPKNLSFEEAAAVPIGALTALFFLKKANIQKGQKILIYGASGSVGTYAIQLAKHFGAEVTGVCSASNLEMIKSIGADHVLDYTSKEFPNQLKKYDVLFLAIDRWPFNECYPYMKEDGIYVNITDPMKKRSMIRRGLTSKKKFIMGQYYPTTPDNLIFLTYLIEEGVIKPVIDMTYSISDIVEAHRYVDLGHKKGNVVITMDTW